MGTLFSQPERKWCSIVESDFEWVLEFCEKHKIKISEYCLISDSLEFRRQNNLMVNDSDIKDEQLAGFGNLLKEFVEAFSDSRRSEDDE